jgi:hypothetical protein
MDIPVLNKGEYLYTVKLNVTFQEAVWILKHKWHKLRGQPWNKSLGNLFEIVAAWRKPGEILYTDPRLVPLERNSVCVAYAQVSQEDHIDLMRFTWCISREGYAVFFNPLLRHEISMHRYLMDFPEKLVVDHVRWNRLDNRRHMLRACTWAENNRNMSYRRQISV